MLMVTPTCSLTAIVLHSQHSAARLITARADGAMSNIVVECEASRITVSRGEDLWKRSLANREFLIGTDNLLRIKCHPQEAFRRLTTNQDLLQSMFVGKSHNVEIAVSITKWYSKNRRQAPPGLQSVSAYTGGSAIGRLLTGDTSWTVIDIFDCHKQVGPKDHFVARCGHRAFFKTKILIPIQASFRSWGNSDGSWLKATVDFASQLFSS